MQHVIQKNDNDCGLAAMAMAVGKSYDEAWTAEDTQEVVENKGISDYEPWMKKLGLERGRDYAEVYTSHMDGHGLKALLRWRRAILSVCSLNNKDGYHAVYWDGDNLFDPSNKRQYEFISSLSITRVILLRGPQP